MICKTCRKKIKTKETRTYVTIDKLKSGGLRDRPLKIYGCMECCNNGSFDKFVDSLPEDED